MSRRLVFLLTLPALALLVWLVTAQLPRWTAPQPGWFAPETPGVCAAVASLSLAAAVRVNPDANNGKNAALETAAQVINDVYGVSTLKISEPLAVQATLPGSERRAYFVVTAQLTADALPKTAVIYVNVDSGEPRTLLTSVDDPALNCGFDVRAALVAALRSTPLILLAVYVLAAGALLAGALVLRHLRGRHR